MLGLLIRFILLFWSRKYCYSPSQAPELPVVIVFGAGLEKTGSLSKVLRERVQTAAWLYHAGKAKKVLFSGENRWVYYDEPLAMKKAGIALGIDAKDILIDHDGFRSLATCVNARDQHGIRAAILVTQSFHLPRVLFLARAIGIQAIGVPATHETHRLDDVLWWEIREIPAAVRAVYDIFRFRFF